MSVIDAGRFQAYVAEVEACHDRAELEVVAARIWRWHPGDPKLDALTELIIRKRRELRDHPNASG
jgi:hypothetical protein